MDEQDSHSARAVPEIKRTRIRNLLKDLECSINSGPAAPILSVILVRGGQPCELQGLWNRLPSQKCLVGGAPGDTYVNRPIVTERGAPTCVQRAWVSPPTAGSRSRAT